MKLENILNDVMELRQQMVGFVYHHFKGKNYVVTDISVHTETEEICVVYEEYHKDPHLTWCRPLSSFLEKVDHTKYPDVEQEFRFEKIGKVLQREKIEMETPAGTLVAEKKGAKDEYPGFFIYLDDDIVACTEFDTTEKQFKTETYCKEYDEPSHIIMYEDGRDIL